MDKIIYEIKIDEEGRPYIYLDEEYSLTPERNFFNIEMAKWLINYAIEQNIDDIDEDSYQNLENCFNVLDILSDEMAEIIKEQMKTSGEFQSLFANNYNIIVKTIRERNALPLDDILYNGKIYSRKIGLKVLVMNRNKIYELKGGIENKNWEEVKLWKNQ